ncbi:SIS domain-containing protein [Streptomyces sp. NPDC058001]|uniref:SIS domain-containing protein n=1 Tax=Streptomyces sp. NPDC058001 TaxID=3346300 RepID=UPI0036E1232D
MRHTPRHMDTELASQPECWSRAADSAPAYRDTLPAPGERIAVVGCGTSLFMAQAAAALRESHGLGESDAFAASAFPLGRRYDRVIALTRSGRTTEVLSLLGRLHGTTPTTAITADPRAPVVRVADRVIVLDYADERSVVQTRFPTTAFTLLRAHFGLHTDTAVEDARDALADPLPLGLAGRAQFTFLGHDWTVGLAHEAALTLRGAALTWSEAYAAMEYRHGPIAITSPGTATWMIGDPPPGLADEVHATGAQWVAGGLDPLAELVRVQRLAALVAAAKRLNADRPRHLTRSVVLAVS